MSLSDEQLMSRVATEDREALAALYDRHAGRLLTVLERMLGTRTEAEDVLQETFWQVWRSAATYEPQRSSPVVWLLVIARSRARDRLRRASRSRPLDAVPEARLLTEPDDDLARSEATVSAREALAMLPDEQRTAIRLAFFNGHTHEQIAAAASIPLGTVKTRIRRGMLRLREILAAREDTVKS